ncbi:protein bric-a-brac 1-like isoform X2 [Arctopsyche grandis]|uniref:protein bric-a-brac 1-like isoform X2 n=1 Tax=Arctopsyche grandis TaxID=121162 RepID=UPI00406D7A19
MKHRISGTRERRSHGGSPKTEEKSSKTTKMRMDPTPKALDVVRIGESGPEPTVDLSVPQDLSRDARPNASDMPPDEPHQSDADDKNPSGGGASSSNTTGGNSSPQQFCLRWNNYQTNLTNVFDQLLQSESFVDVTLACDGHSLKAHKMVLSACSPYFQTLFFENPCQHPIVIMRDIKWPELKAAVEFMYKGEINVSQDQIGPLLRVAESLKIRGLADVNGERETAAAAAAAEVAATTPLHKKSGPRRDEGPTPTKSRKRHHPTGGRSPTDSPPKTFVATPMPTTSASQSLPLVPVLPPLPPLPIAPQVPMHADDMEIKPGIAEMIREEERLSSDEGGRPASESSSLCNELYMVYTTAPSQYQAYRYPQYISPETIVRPIARWPQAKLLENSHGWLGASTSSLADSYQYQLQSMWQKCWNTNQSLVHNLRFRERGPLKSWRPETMAEAIFSVLKEGLSLSQAARKYDIPYPTFVLYANRVHNMLGPSADGAAELRPKGRGRPQRILLGVWPDEHIRGVIRAVVFRDTHNSHHIKEEPLPNYPALTEGMNMQTYGNGSDGGMSPESAAAAAMAAVAHGLRQQMCSMVAAAHHAPPVVLSPCLGSPPQPLPLPAPAPAPQPLPLALEPQLHLALPGNGAEHHYRPYAPPHHEAYFREELDALARSPNVSPSRLVLGDQEPLAVKLEPFGEPRM